MKNCCIILLITFVALLFSCKTITVPDDSISMEIPNDIELITIPAGQYRSGEKATPAIIDYDYKIMKYPVTNEQFLEFLYLSDSLEIIEIDSLGAYGYYNGDAYWEPGIYKFADFTSSLARIGFYSPNIFFTKWRYVENRKEFYDDHPVTFVTWFGANAFAKFYGMRLPNSDEWEKAARSNSIIDYPWGNELYHNYANYFNSGDAYDNDTTPVGYYNGENGTFDSVSPYGSYDMAGNVWEWSATWWRDSSGKIIKGGSFKSPLDNSDGDNLSYKLMTWFIPAVGYLPTNISREIGFRCVYDY